MEIGRGYKLGLFLFLIWLLDIYGILLINEF